MANTYDNRTGIKDVWVITHDDTEVFHISIIEGQKVIDGQTKSGQLMATIYPNIDVYSSSLDGWENRLEVISELKEAAAYSGLPIPIPEFFKSNIHDITSYINDNSTDLLITFTNAGDIWLDLRLTPEDPTPREMAIGLLSQ